MPSNLHPHSPLHNQPYDTASKWPDIRIIQPLASSKHPQSLPTMRPVPGVTDGQQGGDADDTLSPTPTTTPMAWFITTEAALNASGDDPRGLQFHPSCSRRKRSPESTCRSTRSQLPSPTPTRDSTTSLSSSAWDSDLEPETPQDHSPLIVPDIPAGLSRPLSAISVSSGGNSVGATSPLHTSRSLAPSSDAQSRRDAAPQLIMPSLAVPQRRPFSEAGKSVGKLKILVAGQSGKTVPVTSGSSS